MRTLRGSVWIKMTSLLLGLVLLSGCAKQVFPTIADPNPDHVLSRMLTVSDDGAAVAGIEWHGVCVWDAATGSYEVFDWGFIAISPDLSSTALWEKDGSVSIRDLQSGDVVHTFEGLSPENDVDNAFPFGGIVAANLSNVAFSTDGARLAGADAGGRLLIWDAHTEKVLKSFELDDPVRGVVFDPQGERLALLQKTGISQLDIESGEILGRVRAKSKSAISWSPDGTRLAGANADGAPTIWLADDFSVVKTFPGLTADGIALGLSGSFAFTAFQGSPDRSKVFVWFESSGDEAVELSGYYGRPSAVAWAPEGKALYAMSYTSGVSRWDSFSDDAAPAQFKAPPHK